MVKKKASGLKVTPLRAGKFALLKNSREVLTYTIESVTNFYNIYQNGRDGVLGSTSHSEQDLLRAMLVFACSGLDAVAKQLIKDTLHEVIKLDHAGTGARQQFQDFVEKRIKKSSRGNGDEKTSIDTNFIAQLLVSDHPQLTLIKFLQKDLTDGSLQSQDELLRVAAVFAITKDQILKVPKRTKRAFEVRNDIVHQMDVNLSKKQGEKNRKVRGAAEMIEFTENVLNIGCDFINAISEKIYPKD